MVDFIISREPNSYEYDYYGKYIRADTVSKISYEELNMVKTKFMYANAIIKFFVVSYHPAHNHYHIYIITRKF